MPFQKKELPGYFASAASVCAFFFVALLAVVFRPLRDFGIIEFFLFVWLFAQGYGVYLCVTQLIRKISEYRYAKETDVLDYLIGVNLYCNDDAMRMAFQKQRENCIYDDGRMVVTADFFADTCENCLFLLNGILDAESIIYGTGSRIEKVTLSIIYLDGERYKITFRRNEEIERMRDIADRIDHIAKIIANGSINFRKYLPNEE